MLCLIATATLGLRVPPPAFHTRRAAILGSGLAITAGVVLPANALDVGLPFSIPDPIGAYNVGGKSGDPGAGPVKKREDGKPNTGIMLLRETFDGGLPEEGLVAWYETHLADDFTAVFDGGKVTLDKASYLDLTKDLLKSKDFTYTRTGPIAYADSPTIVTWKLGTSAGADVDPETATVYFQSGTKPPLSIITKLKVEPKSGGKGFLTSKVVK